MSERYFLANFGWFLLAAGAIGLAAATGGAVVAAIVCMCWGILYGIASTLP